jgi:hypothetical protein
LHLTHRRRVDATKEQTLRESASASARDAYCRKAPLTNEDRLSLRIEAEP